MPPAVVSVFLTSILLISAVSIFVSRQAISILNLHPSTTTNLLSSSTHQNIQNHRFITSRRHVFSFNDRIIHSDSVLFPDWIVFVVVEELSNGRDGEDGIDYQCVFQNNATSPANYVGRVSATNRRSFKCLMPISVRRLRPFFSPALTKSEVNVSELALNWSTHLTRWTWLVYDTLSTADDVIVFAKGVNRPGRVRSIESIRCVFIDQVSNRKVRTFITSSEQEVFRCGHPDVPEGSRITVTLETLDVSGGISTTTTLVPSVAVYSPYRNNTDKTVSLKPVEKLSNLCACTMVHNVGKFLKEWVMYHSAIGVEKFVLYDNDSDEEEDKLSDVVKELVEDGYNVETVFWPWPKSQEAGFSHSVVSSKSSCKWMMYMDVDEFVFSPRWGIAPKPSSDMLSSVLPRLSIRGSLPVGQVKIQCHDFGPSNQTMHPKNGVTQGYTCRRKLDERHKSIVLLEAVDDSLQNSVHHFRIRAGVYRGVNVGVEKVVVNHYKYQAWSEFKSKFKRRVSTYVPDWTEKVNMKSKDRTPGLGVEAVEPEDWAMKFCEVVDTRLKLLTQKWFGIQLLPNRSDIQMAWER